MSKLARSDEPKVNQVQTNSELLNVKLLAHRAGLPGKEISFILCPLTPPVPLWREGVRPGQKSKISPVNAEISSFALEFYIWISFGI